ncbi:MAG: type II secretion system protein [bacterium]|nr:type II secretion system protein [bacterium]
MKKLLHKLTILRCYISRVRDGFTLIELLVAMTLFVTVLAITSGIFIKSLRSQRTIVSLIAVNNNASLTLEQMAREIRTGICFDTSDSELNFINANRKYVVYRLNLLRDRTGYIERSESDFIPPPDPDPLSFRRITSDDVDVERLRFLLKGESTTDFEQVKITISLRVGSSLAQLRDFFTDIQTTISPRVLDTSRECVL